MIIEYHRPENIEEALQLIMRPSPPTFPLGGGTYLNRPSRESFAVVDLQALKLNGIHKSGQNLWVGGAATLEALRLYPGLQPALTQAVDLEATINLRQQATLAGTLVTAEGRSALATTLLALDVGIETCFLQDGLITYETVELGNWLPQRREKTAGRLITRIRLPLNVELAYEYVARTPKDLPILCVALARWHSGRTRLAVGGFGATPSLAMDGPDAGGAELAAQSACDQAGDEWASAEYRRAAVVPLVRRALAAMTQEEER